MAAIESLLNILFTSLDETAHVSHCVIHVSVAAPTHPPL